MYLKLMKQKVKIKEVGENPENPRIIKDYKFKKLVKSVKEFPENVRSYGLLSQTKQAKTS